MWLLGLGAYCLMGIAFISLLIYWQVQDCKLLNMKFTLTLKEIIGLIGYGFIWPAYIFVLFLVGLTKIEDYCDKVLEKKVITIDFSVKENKEIL